MTLTDFTADRAGWFWCSYASSNERQFVSIVSELLNFLYFVWDSLDFDRGFGHSSPAREERLLTKRSDASSIFSILD